LYADAGMAPADPSHCDVTIECHKLPNVSIVESLLAFKLMKCIL